MGDIAHRFPENPLLSPADLAPSREGLQVACLLNPGVFSFQGATWMILRVAERPVQTAVHISFPVLDNDGIVVHEIALSDPELITTDTRVIRYKDAYYLTTLSHLRLLRSDDGVHFHEVAEYARLWGQGGQETFGIEDCRVVQLDDTYYLTYTAVSPHGVAVGMRSTRDWQNYHSHGIILPPHNKDCALFPEKIGGLYYCFHRPSGLELGGNYIWIASSLDGERWGQHQCILHTRKNSWDSERVGAGAAPIKTSGGWLAIYHGATAAHRYCLGAFLCDLHDPSRVIGRTIEPIMEPTEIYETSGFFGQVVFTNGHVTDGDELTVFYGAADEFVCGAKFSIAAILNAIQEL